MKSDSIYRIARFYIQAGETSGTRSISHVLGEFISATGSVLVKYELNYGPPRQFEVATLEQALAVLPENDFETLSVMERQGAKGFHVQRKFKALGIHDVYEYLFAYRSAENFANQFQRLMRILNSVGVLLYGYGRTVTDDFEPHTEGQMKRSWLGNIVLNGADPVAEWLEHPRGIREGAAKGIYGLNLISDHRQNPPVWLGAEALQRAMKIGQAYLVQLGPTELQALRGRKEFRPFVHDDARSVAALR